MTSVIQQIYCVL